MALDASVFELAGKLGLGNTAPVEDELTQAKAELADATQNRTNLYQSFFDERRKALESQRTTNTNIAKFNALGNIFRTMVQPLGWAAGGSTAGVQKADNRQYLDAYTRAIKLNDDISNVGSQELEAQLGLAKERENRAQARVNALEANQRQVDLINARTDAQIAARQATEDDALEEYYRKNRAAAVKSYFDLLHSDNIHKKGIPSFRDYIGLDGYGKELYGDWNPTDEELQAAAQGVSGQTAPTASESVAPTTGRSTTRTSTTTQTSTITKPQINLTDDEQKIIDTWQKYDKDQSGTLEPEEMKRGFLQFGKPKADAGTAEAYRKAMEKKAKIDGKRKPAATGKGKDSKGSNGKDTTVKKKTAKDIMK